MKFSTSIDIDLPLARVVELWKDEKNLKAWQDGFQRIEHLSGEPGATGARSRLYFEYGKRNMELLETITANNLPHERSALYEHTHMTNTQTTRFSALGEGKTRCTVEGEYTKFNGFMPKLMAFLFPGTFKKQGQKWLEQFKAFAERAGA